MSEKDRDDIPLDPFSVALADQISERNPDLDDAVEGELDALLDDDDTEERDEDKDFIVTSEGVIGIDPFHKR